MFILIRLEFQFKYFIDCQPVAQVCITDLSIEMADEAQPQKSKTREMRDNFFSIPTEDDLNAPNARKLLPDVRPEIFGVGTSSFVFHDKDIENEQVLGSTFNKELAGGKIFQGQLKDDPRMKGFEKLIQDLDSKNHLNDPLPATEIRKAQKAEEEKLKQELETKKTLKVKAKGKVDRKGTNLNVPGSGDSQPAKKNKRKISSQQTAEEFIKQFPPPGIYSTQDLASNKLGSRVASDDKLVKSDMFLKSIERLNADIRNDQYMDRETYTPDYQKRKWLVPGRDCVLNVNSYLQHLKISQKQKKDGQKKQRKRVFGTSGKSQSRTPTSDNVASNPSSPDGNSTPIEGRKSRQSRHLSQPRVGPLHISKQSSDPNAASSPQKLSPSQQESEAAKKRRTTIQTSNFQGKKAPQIELQFVQNDRIDEKSSGRGSAKSAYSGQSYASAANYRKQFQFGPGGVMGDYIDNHPLTQVIQEQSWNNIPVPIKQLFELFADVFIGQDIHTWERKSLINERFFKMQHLAARLNDRIMVIKQEMTRWIEDVMKRTYEHSRKVDVAANERMEEIEMKIKKNEDNIQKKVSALNDMLDRCRGDIKGVDEKAKMENFNTKQEIQRAMHESDVNVAMQIESIRDMVHVCIEEDDPEQVPIGGSNRQSMNFTQDRSDDLFNPKKGVTKPSMSLNNSVNSKQQNSSQGSKGKGSENRYGNQTSGLPQQPAQKSPIGMAFPTDIKAGFKAMMKGSSDLAPPKISEESASPSPRNSSKKKKSKKPATFTVPKPLNSFTSSAVGPPGCIQIRLRDWVMNKFMRQNALQEQVRESQELTVVNMQKDLTKQIADQSHVQKMQLDRVRKEVEKSDTKVKELMKHDPLPPERIEKLKLEIQTELEEVLRPNRSKKNMKGGGLASSASEKVESEHNMEDLNQDESTMKDLIAQVNAMNEKIPKKLEKFQQQMEERQKVTDAKFKRLIKEATDKNGKLIKGQAEKIDKLQKGLQTFQGFFNELRNDVTQLKNAPPPKMARDTSVVSGSDFSRTVNKRGTADLQGSFQSKQAKALSQDETVSVQQLNPNESQGTQIGPTSTTQVPQLPVQQVQQVNIELQGAANAVDARNSDAGTVQMSNQRTDMLGATLVGQQTQGTLDIQQPIDVFQMDLGTSDLSPSLGGSEEASPTKRTGSLGGSEAANEEAEEEKEPEEEEEEEDYMELYVQKELKDKIEPVLEQLNEHKTDATDLADKVKELEDQIIRVDKHYNGVAKAMLERHGVVLEEINEFNILQEHKRYKEKEAKALERLKRENMSMSPPSKDRNPEFVKQLQKKSDIEVSGNEKRRAHFSSFDCRPSSTAQKNQEGRNTSFSPDTLDSAIENMRKNRKDQKEKEQKIADKFALDVNNESIGATAIETEVEVAKLEVLEVNSESIMHSTVQDNVDPITNLDGGSQYIYEQFNEKKSTATEVVDATDSRQQSQQLPIGVPKTSRDEPKTSINVSINTASPRHPAIERELSHFNHNRDHMQRPTFTVAKLIAGGGENTSALQGSALHKVNQLNFNVIDSQQSSLSAYQHQSLFQPQFSTQRGNNLSLQESAQASDHKQQRQIRTRGSTREANNRSTRNELSGLTSINTAEIKRMANIQDIMLKTQLLRQGTQPTRGQFDPRAFQTTPQDANSNLLTTQHVSGGGVFGKRKPSTADPNAPGGRQRRHI